MTELRTCVACGSRMPIGALLEVVPVNELASPFVVCRPGGQGECLAFAGPRSRTTIRTLDAVLRGSRLTPARHEGEGGRFPPESDSGRTAFAATFWVSRSRLKW